MKTILVINDNSPGAEHAAALACIVAGQMECAVLMANTAPVTRVAPQVPAGRCDESTPEQAGALLKSLDMLNDIPAGLTPPVTQLDIAGMDENQLAQMINHQEILMIVKGAARVAPPDPSRLNINSILNKVRCPLLLVPEAWQIKKIERVVYIADMRFCRTNIVNYLAVMAKYCAAAFSVANLSAKGIPDMEENYANNVFKKEVYDRLEYKQVFFNNIREKDLKKALDVMINGMHNDILAFVNHRFHFEEILGRYLTDVLPENITVPLLIFPY